MNRKTQFIRINRNSLLACLFIFICHFCAFATNDTTNKLFLQMDTLLTKKNYKEVIALGESNLSKLKKNSLNYAHVLYRLAQAHKGLSHFSQTGKLLKQSMKVAEKYGDLSIELQCDIAYALIDYNLIVEPENSDNIFNNTALDKSIRAVELLNEELDLIRKDSINLDSKKENSIVSRIDRMMWRTDYYYAKALLNFSFYHNSDEILNICDELKSQTLKLFGGNSEVIAQVYLVCGRLQEAIPRYEEALKYYNNSLELYSLIYGEKSLDCAKVNYHIGMVEASLGDTNKALERFKRIIEIHKQQLIYDDTYIATLEAISTIYATRGEYDEALNFLQKAEEHGSKLFGLKSSHTYKCKLKMADIMIASESYDKAQAIIDDVEKKNEELEWEINELFFLQAQLFIKNNQFAHARIVLQGCIELLENGYQKESHDLAIKFYNSLGYCSYRTGQYNEAYEYYKKYLDLAKRYARDIFVFMPESKREHYWRLQSQHLESLLNINHTTTTYDPNRDEIMIPTSSFDKRSSLLYDAALLQKGTLLEASKNMLSAIENNENKELQQKMKRLQEIQQLLSGLARYGKNSTGINIEQLQSEGSKLEQDLITHARQYAGYMTFLNISWQDIHKTLGDNDVAIEFVCSSDNGRKHYSAEILRKNFTAPKHIPLFSVTENSSLAFNMNRPDRFLWPKIIPYINEQDNVYFAASGDLHKHSIEYFLINNQDRMHDKYNMYRVSSTRQLALSAGPHAKGNVTLYGGMDYNLGLEEMAYYSEISRNRGDNTHANMSQQESTPFLWGYLPGTENEVLNISPILEHEGYRTTTYLGAESVEENFKIQSGNSSHIIHIATHGFYQPRETQKGMIISDFQTTVEDESLLCSGLIFSGANHAWLSKDILSENIDDGILTSKEIASMNLQSTDLVVLSACQTGQGEVTGEGVFGLQRAFKKAGCGTILMTLWEVNDAATQILMTSFYSHYAKGINKHEALKMAQAEIKDKVFINDKGIETSGKDPHFWASFILLD